MGMDVSIWAVKPVVCPHCGGIATYEVDDRGEADDMYYGSHGHVWHEFLPTIGGDIPYEDPEDVNERYGQDYMMTKEETERLVKFLDTSNPYNYKSLLSLCYKVLALYTYGYRLMINADW